MSELEIMKEKNGAICDEIICLKKEIEKLRMANEQLVDNAKNYRAKLQRQRRSGSFQCIQYISRKGY